MTTEVHSKMEQSLVHLRAQLAKIHTGRANPGLVEELQIEAYDSKMRLMELASISAPQASLLLIQPWDKSVIPAIVHAIQSANVGLNPQEDGDTIRVPIPPLSQERREQLIKIVKGEIEEAKVAIRALRHEEREAIQVAKKDGTISEDEADRRDKELQKITDDFVAKIDAIGESKEKELLEV